MNTVEDESGFFLHFITNCSLFAGSEEADAQKCQEFAESLFEERIILQYIERLGFIKYYKVQKLNTLQIDPEDEEEENIKGPSRRNIDIQYNAGKSISFEEPNVRFLYKDIIHTFAINPLNNLQVAMGTNSGILELDLEAGSDFLRDFPEGTTGKQISSHYHIPSIHFPSPLKMTKSVVKEKKDKLKKSKDKKRKIEKSDKNYMSKTSNKLTRTTPSNRNSAVYTLCPHPHNPYYLSGSANGAVVLWQYKVPSSIVSYRAVSDSKVYRLRFNESGSKFAACDHSGSVSLWRMSFQENRSIHTECCDAILEDVRIWRSLIWDLISPRRVIIQINQIMCNFGTVYYPIRKPMYGVVSI